MHKRAAALAIDEAERRVARSVREAGEALHRARLAGRAALTRPSTLLTVAGVAGLFFYWQSRRANARPVPAAAAASGRVLLLAFIRRLVMRRLASLVR